MFKKNERINVEDSLPPMFEDVLVVGIVKHINVCPQIWQARRWTGITSGFDVEKDKLWNWLTPTDSDVIDVKYWKTINGKEEKTTN